MSEIVTCGYCKKEILPEEKTVIVRKEKWHGDCLLKKYSPGLYKQKKNEVKNQNPITEEIDSITENRLNSYSGNSIATIMKSLGHFYLGIGFLLGFYIGSTINEYGEFNFFAAFICWLTTAISGLFVFGFAEIIELLHSINSKLKNQNVDSDM